MKLLWTWVQSAKWPLKMTRKQANRRLFREQWPRQKVQGQKGEGVLWTKRTLEWRIQPSELRRSTQSNSFPKAWPLRGHRSTKLKEGRKFMDFWVWWVPPGPALLHAHRHLLLGLHGTELNPDMTTLSPGLGVPEHLFFQLAFYPRG